MKCIELHTSFFRNTVQTNTNTHIRTSTHLYKYTHIHPTPMSTSERLSQLNLEIHEVSHQERLAVDGWGRRLPLKE
jgi:hypothetical protein